RTYGGWGRGHRLRVAAAEVLRGRGEELLRTPSARSATSLNATAELEQELRTAVEGEVRFGARDRAIYATDASNYRQLPIGVVIPKTVEDVVSTVAVCRSHRVPILSRGGGTSLAGQCCNVAVVIDHSKYLR